MTLADTYKEQVVQSRQDRARKAIFLSRIVGLMLMLLIGFVLRVEPDLRSAFAEAGMGVIATMTGREAPSRLASASTAGNGGAPSQSTLPPSRVKVNRGTGPSTTSTASDRVDAQAQADALRQRLDQIKVGE